MSWRRTNHPAAGGLDACWPAGERRPQVPQPAVSMRQQTGGLAQASLQSGRSHIQQQAARVLNNLLDALQERDRLAPAAGRA